MNGRKRQLTLKERWELDIKAYKEGVNVKTSSPQCEECNHFIEGNAMHCNVYKDEKKPKYVMFCEKECPSFKSSDIMEINIVNDDYKRLYGGIFGFCIGDMLGVPVEFSTREEREVDEVRELRAYGTYHQPFGTWSDDTSLMLCLIDTYNNGFSISSLANNFIKFYQNAYYTSNGEVFDIGIATKNAIEKMIRGVKPTECGGKTEMDNGNGSLMRVLPIAFIRKKLNDENFIEMVEDVSSLTHAHKRAKLACIFYVEFASQLILGKEKMEAYDSTINFIRRKCSEEYFTEFKNFKAILNKEIVAFDRTQIKSTGYVVDTLEAVIWIFMNFNSYKEMVLRAVNLGGDTDTIAAIVGGLAGIYYGFNSIPDRWVQNVSRKSEINDMIKIFYDCF